MNEKKILLMVAVLLLVFQSCQLMPQQPACLLTGPMVHEETGNLRFTLKNTGVQDIVRFTVQGYCWLNEGYLPVRGMCSTKVAAGDDIVFEIPVAAEGMIPDRFFLQEIVFGDESVWYDPRGIFTKYYIRQ